MINPKVAIEKSHLEHLIFLAESARNFYNATIGDKEVTARAYSESKRDCITAHGEELRGSLEKYKFFKEELIHD